MLVLRNIHDDQTSTPDLELDVELKSFQMRVESELLSSEDGEDNRSTKISGAGHVKLCDQDEDQCAIRPVNRSWLVSVHAFSTLEMPVYRIEFEIPQRTAEKNIQQLSRLRKPLDPKKGVDEMASARLAVFHKQGTLSQLLAAGLIRSLDYHFLRGTKQAKAARVSLEITDCRLDSNFIDNIKLDRLRLT